MKELVGYPSGAIIRVNGVEFSWLKKYDLIRYDDEPNYDLDPEEFEATDGGGQWRYEDNDEAVVKRVISMARKVMRKIKLNKENIQVEDNMLTEKKKLAPMLARLKKKGKLKLKREDIQKYGTEEEIKKLNEDVYGYQGGNAPASQSEEDAYQEGITEGETQTEGKLSMILIRLGKKYEDDPNANEEWINGAKYALLEIAEEFGMDLDI